MIQLEQSPSVKLIPFQMSFMAGVLEGIRRLVARGVSLGLVLFLALGTLRFLDHGATYLVSSAKKLAVSEKKETRNPVTFQAIQARNVARVAVSAYEPRRVPVGEKRPDMAEMLRESRYLLSTLESFSHSFSRIAK